MARDHARILCGIWQDPDWQQRSPEAQRLYFLLLSQRTINNAGVLPLMVNKWARGSVWTTVEDIETALDELYEHEYVVVDRGTDEVLVRTFIRNDGVAKQPNVLKNALREARQVESPTLRQVLGDELRRVGLAITVEVADEIAPVGDGPVDAAPTNQVGEPQRNPSGNPSGNPSRNHSGGVRKSGENGAKRNPSGNPSVNPSLGSAGMGMGMGSSGSRSVGGCESRADARTRVSPAELSASGHSPEAHAILGRYAEACTKRPPTSTLNRLGPKLDELLTEGFTVAEIDAGFAELVRRGLGTHLLAEITHETAEAAAREPDHELMAYQPPTPPREIRDDPDPQVAIQWQREQFAEWDRNRKARRT